MFDPTDQKAKAEKPKEKSKPGPRNLPWREIALDYICDPTQSIRKISDKYGIAKSTVSSTAVKEGWVEQRMAVQKRLSGETLELVESFVAKERLRLAKTARTLLIKGFRKIEKEDPKNGKQAVQYINQAAKIYREFFPVLIANRLETQEGDDMVDLVVSMIKTLHDTYPQDQPESIPLNSEDHGLQGEEKEGYEAKSPTDQNPSE